MGKSISTPSTSHLESTSKDVLIITTTFLDNNSQLELAHTCKKLLNVYKACLQKVDFLLLCTTKSDAKYFNWIKPSLGICRTGWRRTKVSSIKVSNFDTCEYPFVNGIYLEEPFELPW
jgi:hypothetical protein